MGGAKKRKEKLKTNGPARVSERVPSFVVPLVRFDVLVTEKLSICARPESKMAFLRPHMKVLELSCHGIPWLAGCLALLCYSWTSHMQETLVNFLMALLVDIVIVAVIKAATRRGRPKINDMDMFATFSVDGYAFPSGHASRAVLVTYLLAYRCDLTPVLWVLVAVWSTVVCISRILLGRHHVGDVLAGAVLGYLEYYLVTEIMWLKPETCQSLLRSVFNFDIDPVD